MTAPAVNKQEQAEMVRLRGLVEHERVRRSCPYYAERFCWTRDEHDTVRPFKPLIGGTRAVAPDSLAVAPIGSSVDDYLRWLTVLWQEEPLLVVPKSRQLRISWWAMGMICWLSQAFVSQRVAVQSKQLSDADKLLDRAMVILDLQRQVAPFIPWPEFSRRYGLLTVRHPGGIGAVSRIEALAQGGNKIRSEPYSMVFSDEMAFQAEAEEGFAAAMPVIEGGGRYLAVSSANPSTYFGNLVNDAP